MPSRSRWTSVFLILAACVGGALSGLVVMLALFVPKLSSWQTQLTYQTLASSTERALQFFSSEPSAPRALSPTVLLSRRLSPLAAIVKQAKMVEVTWTSDEHRVGDAVALSADGWLATTWTAVSSLHRADMGIAWNGRVYPVTKAIHDKATDVVFLKIEAQGLPVTGFAPSSNVTPGSSLWLEPRSKRLYGSMVIDVRTANDTLLSSEYAQRRFLVSGSEILQSAGGAVWNEKGELVGLLETPMPEGWHVLPASDIASSLTAILSGQEISHPLLGARGLDLSSLAFETVATVPASSGVWVKNFVSGSPASRAFQPGDVIERVERDILDGNADLGERLLDYVPGSQVTFFIKRAGTPLQIPLKLGSVTTSEILK